MESTNCTNTTSATYETSRVLKGRSNYLNNGKIFSEILKRNDTEKEEGYQLCVDNIQTLQNCINQLFGEGCNINENYDMNILGSEIVDFYNKVISSMGNLGNIQQVSKLAINNKNRLKC